MTHTRLLLSQRRSVPYFAIVTARLNTAFSARTHCYSPYGADEGTGTNGPETLRGFSCVSRCTVSGIRKCRRPTAQNLWVLSPHKWRLRASSRTFSGLHCPLDFAVRSAFSCAPVLCNTVNNCDVIKKLIIRKQFVDSVCGNCKPMLFRVFVRSRAEEDIPPSPHNLVFRGGGGAHLLQKPRRIKPLRPANSAPVRRHAVPSFLLYTTILCIMPKVSSCRHI